MLSFKVYQFHVLGRYYTLLPKLTPPQVRSFAGRLKRNGFHVEPSPTLTARSREGVVHVGESGLCWSSFDPSDSILPAIPEVLAFPKQTIPLRELRRKYFSQTKSGANTVVHFSIRMESASLWRALRASGECGLAPDEHAVASFILRHSEGTCELVTDFPAAGSVPLMCGRKRYFISSLGKIEAALTLRDAGEKNVRNSYVRRDSTIGLEAISLSRDDLLRLFEELGEWCFFSPS
ncbi:MAG TPA: hypothetical protein VEB87_01385 [Nitrososphaerales archaeon]|nr:hypothetical protein [Nitrososphaerales archaeon]